MLNFIVYGRKSKDTQNAEQTQHTFATQEWLIQNYLTSLDRQGIEYKIVASFEETVSGGGYYTNRPIFSKVVQMCKDDKSLTLLCAKAERLARNVRSGAELMEVINFVLANAPDADNMQKQLEFMIAEREYHLISQRFKDMYQAKKSRCEKEGKPMNWGAASPKYNRTNSVSKRTNEAAKSRTEAVSTTIKLLMSVIIRPTCKSIAEALTKSGILLPSGIEGVWTATQVSRVCKRHEIIL